MSKIRFWKPGTQGPGQSLKQEKFHLSTCEDHVSSFIFNPHKATTIEQQRQRLPIFNHRTEILYLIEKHQTVIIIGETGSGKSTQIPQYLLEANWAGGNKVICVTQPRRIAVITVASRVAEERASLLGDEVGYAIRFEDQADQTRTRLKFVTDGLLIREMMADPLLSSYSVIMFDEAHERTLNTDIALGLLKKVAKKRPDLRLIISSATLDAEQFRDFFNFNTTNDSSKDTAVILSVKGRTFPVEVFFSDSPVANYLKASVDTVMSIHNKEAGTGGILVFLTGVEEIQHVSRLLVEHAHHIASVESKKVQTLLQIVPFHGSLPNSEQLKAFERPPPGTRKVVVATNIAEASITIPNILYVVDCGFVKLRVFEPNTGTDSLMIVPISKSSAIQRTGRAGRVQSGKAFRLYEEKEFHKLPDSTEPEIRRTNMATMILRLKALGIDNVLRFDFPSAPPAENMLRGLELLYAIGSLDDMCSLTIPLGLQMAEFPLEPMFARMLLASVEPDFACAEEALSIVAMMQIQNVFITPTNKRSSSQRAKRRFSVSEGDLITLLNVYRAFIKFNKSSKWCHENFLNYHGLLRAIEIRQQLEKILYNLTKQEIRSCGDDVSSICRCIVSGFFTNAARLDGSGDYRTIREDYPLSIHPNSVITFVVPLPKFVLFNEVVKTTKNFMMDITVIEPSWLYQLAPNYYQYGTRREIAANNMPQS